MLKKLYTDIIFPNPKKVLIGFFVILSVLGYFATKLEIDASAETLLLENDTDLEFSRTVAKRYATSDFLIVTFKPNDYLLSERSLKKIKELSNEFEKLELVTSVTSILNIPLLQSPPKPVKELLADIPSLEKGGVDKKLAEKELLSSPLYVENLVSKDFKTTSLLVNLKDDVEYRRLLDKRDSYRKKELTKEEQLEFEKVEAQFKAYRDLAREKNHQNIVKVRKIIKKYQQYGKLHLGGVTMIADDMVEFVKSDLSTFGVAVFLLLFLVLGLLFRELRWVVIPVSIATFGIIATSGLFGMFSWEITVVSSNFISLLLIMAMSLIIHLSVKYREVLYKYPENSQQELVLETVLTMAKPSFFVVITTIAGFSSLVLSNILPIINFGWMMSLGIVIALLISFIVFPSIMILLPKTKGVDSSESSSKFTTFLAEFSYRNKYLVLGVTGVALLFALSGASKLLVENSFIDYFKKDTDIYKGMTVIDQNLGGTTPLDVILTFKEDEVVEVGVADDSFEDDLDDFDDEYETEESPETYWFTEAKMEKIKEVHDYLESIPAVGKVLSLATMGEVGKALNDGKPIDSFALALLYQELPAEYRSIILDPYLDIENDQVRLNMRIIDSMKDLRRNELITKINKDLQEILNPKYEEFRLSNMMILYNNMLNSLFDSQIRTIGLVITLLFIMFLVLFRSLKIALVAIVVNIVPVSVIFGVMGWFGMPLDMMTITIAAISIGIAVDNTIHYIHRFKVEFAKTGDYVQSMYNGHKSIGTAMFYTSLTIMIGFSVLMLSSFIPTIYFGLLTVIAMLMAIVADLMLLPVLLIVFKPLGRKND
ncbi:MAG: MMPL family transporter [Campylobacterales bacterium]|nr:MMPL family transporter [Campylobacterales bacterium]